MSERCHICGPVKHEAPTVICAPCALANNLDFRLFERGGYRIDQFYLGEGVSVLSVDAVPARRS